MSEVPDKHMSSTGPFDPSAPPFMPGEPWLGSAQADDQDQRPQEVDVTNNRYFDLDDSLLEPEDIKIPNTPESFLPGDQWSDEWSEVHDIGSTPPVMIEPPYPVPVYIQYIPFHFLQSMPAPHMNFQEEEPSAEVQRQRKIDNAYEARRSFDYFFGTDPTNLRTWQDICYICGRDAETMPRTIKACRKWLGQIYVNVFDLVEAAHAYQVVEPRFDCAADLECYTHQTGKMCPSFVARGNDVLGFMLRKLKGTSNVHKR